jgi:hypothetical protein
MHVLSETWVMSRSIQAGKSGLEPKPTSLLQPVTWVTGKEIGLRGRWRRFWRERPLLEAAAFKKETPPRRLGRVPRRGLVRRASARSPTMILYQASSAITAATTKRTATQASVKAPVRSPEPPHHKESQNPADDASDDNRNPLPLSRGHRHFSLPQFLRPGASLPAHPFPLTDPWPSLWSSQIFPC